MIAIDIPLRWGDMDAYGHINNVEIVRLMEEARVITFGIPSGTGHIDGTNPPAHIDLLAGVGDEVMTLISEHTVKYRRQLPYRGLPVRVEVGVEKVKGRSEEHTSELQSRGHLVCRLLLAKKNNKTTRANMEE